jgi:hypothetical protein
MASGRDVTTHAVCSTTWSVCRDVWQGERINPSVEAKVLVIIVIDDEHTKRNSDMSKLLTNLYPIWEHFPDRVVHSSDDYDEQR